MKLKNVLFLLVVTIVVSSCVTLKNIPSSKIEYGIDLTKYSDKGFLITPEKYNGEYLLLTIYTLNYYPASHDTTIYDKNHGITHIGWLTDKINMNELFDIIYDNTISKNGDAFINLKFDDIIKHVAGGPFLGIEGIKITGWMIKRTSVK